MAIDNLGRFIKGSVPHNKRDFISCRVPGCCRTDHKAYGYCTKHHTMMRFRKKKGQPIDDISLSKRLPRTKEHVKNNLAYIKSPDYVSPLKGKTYKDIYGNRAEIASLKRSGENSGTWKGGLSFEKYPEIFKSSRKIIRNKYNFRCAECGISEFQLNRKLDVHHIDFNKKNNNENNLIALCKKCHGNTQRNRQQWIEYYSKKVEVSK